MKNYKLGKAKEIDRQVAIQYWTSLIGKRNAVKKVNDLIRVHSKIRGKQWNEAWLMRK